MNILNYCLRNKVDAVISTIKRPCSAYYRASVLHNKNTCLLSTSQPAILQSIPNRCFMKKMGLNPIYDVYNKKAAKDQVLSTEYTLIYNGIGESYVRYLSGIVVAVIILIPSVSIGTYLYLLLTEGKIDFKTYLEILLIPHSALELMIMIPTLFLLKLAAYSFISKYVLRIYRHNTKTQHIGVYINPFLPWKNISCRFERAEKLPESKFVFIPWYKEYYKLGGYKSIILRERFRRPIDYDRMLGTVKSIDD